MRSGARLCVQNPQFHSELQFEDAGASLIEQFGKPHRRDLHKTACLISAPVTPFNLRNLSRSFGVCCITKNGGHLQTKFLEYTPGHHLQKPFRRSGTRVILRDTEARFDRFWRNELLRNIHAPGMKHSRFSVLNTPHECTDHRGR
jgi:hypothetical protein